MKKKDKKRGVTLLEMVLAVALISVLLGIMGPILRYYTKLTNRYDYGISSIVDINTAEQFLEKSLSLTNIANTLTANDSLKANTGIVVGDINGPFPTTHPNLAFGINIVNGNNSNPYIKFLMKPGINIGNTLFVESPVVYNNPNDPNDPKNNKVTLCVFSVFRFVTAQDPMTGEWTTVLTYSTTYDPTDYSYDYVAELANANEKIPFISEVQILPPTISKIKLVPNFSSNSGSVSEVSTLHPVKKQNGTDNLANLNYFQAIPGGVKMRFTYYPDPSNLSIKAVGEKVFLKRGEI